MTEKDGDGEKAEVDYSKGEGNFRALLKFRVESGDHILEQHLNDSKNNATYVSPLIQNLLIDSCGKIIQDELIHDIKKAKYFSILADETTDTAHLEQMSLCARYYLDGMLFEKFIKFVNVKDLTGPGLANTILSEITSVGLDVEYLIGQGYDGASSMSGQFHGVQAEIRVKVPTAAYVHCAAHCLNLTISKSSEVQAIRNSFGVVAEATNFINSSAKRVNCLKEVTPENQHKSLKRLCDTRWVERHDAVLTFSEMFLNILDCLHEISLWTDPVSSTKARMVEKSLQNAEFIVSLLVLQKILSLTVTLSKQLQIVNSDLVGALNLVKNVVDVLKVWRNNDTFTNIFTKAKG